MFTTVRRSVSALFLISASLTIGFSQTSSANLTGLITDTASVVIPGVSERIKVQFRAEAFNLTNTPQFSWPDTAFGSTTFGVVSGTMNIGPRNVQFGLKVDF